ncbi:hypothetical protein BGZ76_010479 [Entomortierella beljakovae]|nr:hypothetical protein BGZ76_010479 [Entomortierella beljakovae]
MSRISCQQSTHWLAASLRVSGLYRSNQQQLLRHSKNRSVRFNNTQLCLYSSQAKRANHIDPAKLDSISQTLINDLYTTRTPSLSKERVTLDDILALKPEGNKISVDDFNKLKELIAASFNVSQLKGVLRSQNQASNGKKSVLINQIMILLNLEVTAPKHQRSVVEDPYNTAEPILLQQIFPSNKRELFFILGSEGNSLRQLEKEKQVNISINIADETYIIKGGRESIAEAQQRVREMVAVTEESWDISSYNDKDLILSESSVMEDIARRSDTYVVRGNEGYLNIAGRTDRDIEEAKRLFDVKLSKKPDNIESLTFFHQEDELKPVGMFPVYDSINMSLDENKKSFFRICQTDPYVEDTVNYVDTIYPANSSLSSINSLEDLGNHMKETLKKTYQPNQTHELSANFGQVLHRNMNSSMSQVPFPHSFDTLELDEWLKGAREPYFFQSLPFFKAVSQLPLISPKSKVIEVEYIPSSRQQPTLDTSEPINSSAVRLSFQFDNDGELYIHDGHVVNRQTLANLMMLGHPTDVQIRSELLTKIDADSPVLKDILNQTTLPYINRLQCPSFYPFNGASISSTPAAAKIGLDLTPTHTLRSILFKTTGIFNFNGLPLIASDIVDQLGKVRKQELKLLIDPIKEESEQTLEAPDLTSSDSTQSSLSSSSSPPSSSSLNSILSSLDGWDEFVNATLKLNRAI